MVGKFVSMRHKKLIKREDGSKVSIDVSVWLDSFKGAVYELGIKVCEKGKRKFRRIEKDDYMYRSLSMPDRRKDMYNEYLKYVSENDLKQAKLELWEKLKP